MKQLKQIQHGNLAFSSVAWASLIMTAALCLTVLPATAEEPDQIIIPHGIHFEEDMACADCHDGVAESASASESFFPEMDICSDCHDVDDEANCSMCHTNADMAGEMPREDPTAIFSHELHVQQGQSCSRCHGDPALAQPLAPGKPDCRLCHETADDYADCGLCHAPEFELQPTSHDLGWINLHGMEAGFDEDACAQCHTQNSCQECHSGDNVRPRSHDLNYSFNHALDAKSNSLDCSTCHFSSEFCRDCHIAERILPTNHSDGGWVSMGTGGRHAYEGFFEIENCIACHGEGPSEPTCARCHEG